jgi:hypothetical protein
VTADGARLAIGAVLIAVSLALFSTWLLLRSRLPMCCDPTGFVSESGCSPAPARAEVVVSYGCNDPHTFTGDERRAIREVAERAIPDVRRLLPDLPPSIVLRVGTSKAVIAETGENADNWQPNIVQWYVDASRSEGVAMIARSQLRPTLFHELHHLVRAGVVESARLRDHVIREGLANAFERDFGGGVLPPWSQYSSVDIARWTTEVLALPDDAPRGPWLFQHPDGRRWIGHRVGTYLVDRAMKSSGRTSADLVRTPTDTVVTMGLAR